jgi:hypothetical protein
VESVEAIEYRGKTQRQAILHLMVMVMKVISQKVVMLLVAHNRRLRYIYIRVIKIQATLTYDLKKR